MAYKKEAVNIERDAKKSRIKLAGIELEGGWKAVPKGVTYVGDRPPRPGQLGRDGSLDPMKDRHIDDVRNGALIVGELPSLPMEEAAIEKWLRAHYPQVFGPECGMHVHISLDTPILYMQLMDEAYPATVIEYTKQWATKENIPQDNPLWGRLRGECIYCQHVFAPDAQVANTAKDYEKTRPGHRYTAINYCHGRETGTVENRLLPMFDDIELGIRAVQNFLSITNRYLLATAKREKKVKSTFTISSDTQVKRVTVRV